MNEINNFVMMALTPNNIIIILIIFLLVLIGIIMVVIRNSIMEERNKKEEILEIKKESKKDSFDLSAVTKLLEENMGNERNITVNEYESEQEKKAIISYDELLKNASSLTINYEDTPNIDGVKVKKVEIETTKKPAPIPTTNVNNRSFYSYEREEEFLRVLKQFRANL